MEETKSQTALTDRCPRTSFPLSFYTRLARPVVVADEEARHGRRRGKLHADGMHAAREFRGTTACSFLAAALAAAAAVPDEEARHGRTAGSSHLGWTPPMNSIAIEDNRRGPSRLLNKACRRKLRSWMTPVAAQAWIV